MATLALDLGGTKLATAVFSTDGEVLFREVTSLNGKGGYEVGMLVQQQIERHLKGFSIASVGISVPGISRHQSGTVWAPNIPGWEDFPLLEEMKKVAPDQPIVIESDRACSILGEQWKGNAAGCRHAIFMAVGTGIGAGILDDGRLVRGASDVGGAVGWMALRPPYESKYQSCGCFEYYASGAGIPKFASEILRENPTHSSLREIAAEELSAYHIFDAYGNNDPVAVIVIQNCVAFWGMGAANLISIFNPEKIIFGGGLFGPAIPLIEEIKSEALKWAQPVSAAQVIFQPAALGSDAAVYGAACLAMKAL